MFFPIKNIFSSKLKSRDSFHQELEKKERFLDNIQKKFEKTKGWIARKLSSENHTEQVISVLEERSIWQRYGF